MLPAVDRWDPDRGPAFSTFAVPTVLGDLRRHFRDTAWAVRPPRDLQELALAVEGARARLGREPTVRDFAAQLARSPDHVTEALQAVERRARPASLAGPPRGLSDRTWPSAAGGDRVRPGLIRRA